MLPELPPIRQPQKETAPGALDAQRVDESKHRYSDVSDDVGAPAAMWAPFEAQAAQRRALVNGNTAAAVVALNEVARLRQAALASTWMASQ